MKYPAFNEYQAALQHPAQCLTPSGLQRCVAEADLWGLPRVRSGGFALTYKLTDGKSTWALRCFHKHVPDREERYACINQFIEKTSLDYLVKIKYISDGISIKGGRYPITFMQWIEGETLESYVIRHLDQPAVLSDLAVKFYHLVLDLEKHRITHGDLSHHNIMVKDEKLILVDYDGMNVPEMKQHYSCEIGNPHFQHPGRDESIFDLSTDRFSSIVIYLAIKALSIDKKFWFSYETGGEGLLFRRQDFEQPFHSPLLQEMETIAALNRDVRQFRQICARDVREVPRLEEFVNGLGLDLFLPVENTAQVESGISIVLDAQKRYLITSRLGEIATVVGRIDEVFSGKTRDGVPHLFMNFGDWKMKCFTVVVWDEALNLMQTTGIDPQDYIGKWVSVKGMLTAYKRRPQVIINTPFDIEVLDEVVVADRIAASSTHWFTRREPVLQTIRKRNSKPQEKAAGLKEERVQVQVLQPVPRVAESKPAVQSVLDAQVANPLDIPNDVVGRLNALYKTPKTKTRSARKKKPRK